MIIMIWYTIISCNYFPCNPTSSTTVPKHYRETDRRTDSVREYVFYVFFFRFQKNL